MSDKQIITLIGASQREYGKRLIDSAPAGYVMTLAEMTRTLEQNAKLWPMLADVRKAKPDDRQHTSDTWKSLFMHSLNHQVEFERALDDRGVVPLGFKTSQLSKGEFAALIECIYEYGARKGVLWSEKPRLVA